MNYILTPLVLVSLAIVAIIGVILSPLVVFLFWAGKREQLS